MNTTSDTILSRLLLPLLTPGQHNARYLAIRSRLYQLRALTRDANEDVEQVARVDIAREYPRLHLRTAGTRSTP